MPGEDAAAVQQEHSGHLEGVALCAPYAMPLDNPGAPRPRDEGGAEELAPVHLLETEGPVGLAVGVAEAGKIVQSIAFEHAADRGFVGHVHESDHDPVAFDARARRPQIGQGLAAEGAAEMAKENEQHRGGGGEV